MSTRLEVAGYHVLDAHTGAFLGTISVRTLHEPGEEFQACGRDGYKMVHTIEEGEAFIADALNNRIAPRRQPEGDSGSLLATGTNNHDTHSEATGEPVR